MTLKAHYSLAEYADLTGTPLDTVRKQRQRGQLRAHKVAGRWIILLTDLLAERPDLCAQTTGQRAAPRRPPARKTRLTLREYADLTGQSLRTVRSHRQRGHLRAHKIAGRWVILMADLRADHADEWASIEQKKAMEKSVR